MTRTRTRSRVAGYGDSKASNHPSSSVSHTNPQISNRSFRRWTGRESTIDPFEGTQPDSSALEQDQQESEYRSMLQRLYQQCEDTHCETQKRWPGVLQAYTTHEATESAYRQALRKADSEFDDPRDQWTYLNVYSRRLEECELNQQKALVDIQPYLDAETAALDQLDEHMSKSSRASSAHGQHRRRVRRRYNRPHISVSRYSGTDSQSRRAPQSSPAVRSSHSGRSSVSFASTGSTGIRRSDAVRRKPLQNVKNIRLSRTAFDHGSSGAERSDRQGRFRPGLRSSVPCTTVSSSNTSGYEDSSPRHRSATVQRSNPDERRVAIVEKDPDRFPSGTYAPLVAASELDSPPGTEQDAIAVAHTPVATSLTSNETSSFP
ncbi:hypothetical protein IAU59_001463 [Kwoniella sp. CBS 9459]